MADEHEMRMIRGRIRAVYIDGDGHEYLLVDGEREYLGSVGGAAERGDDAHRERQMEGE